MVKLYAHSAVCVQMCTISFIYCSLAAAITSHCDFLANVKLFIFLCRFFSPRLGFVYKKLNISHMLMRPSEISPGNAFFHPRSLFLFSLWCVYKALKSTFGLMQFLSIILNLNKIGLRSLRNKHFKNSLCDSMFLINGVTAAPYRTYTFSLGTIQVEYISAVNISYKGSSRAVLWCVFLQNPSRSSELKAAVAQ